MTSVHAQHYLNNSASESREVGLITYVKGEMKQYVSDTNQGNTPADAVSVTAGSKAVGWNTVLALNGDLLRNGAPIATNVTSATAQHQTTGAGEVWDFVSWTTAADAFTRTFGGTNAPTGTTFASVPAGSTTAGFGTYHADRAAVQRQQPDRDQGDVGVLAAHQGQCRRIGHADLGDDLRQRLYAEDRDPRRSLRPRW